VPLALAPTQPFGCAKRIYHCCYCDNVTYEFFAVVTLSHIDFVVLHGVTTPQYQQICYVTVSQQQQSRYVTVSQSPQQQQHPQLSLLLL
jgi:hypothetical protein